MVGPGRWPRFLLLRVSGSVLVKGGGIFLWWPLGCSSKGQPGAGLSRWDPRMSKLSTLRPHTVSDCKHARGEHAGRGCVFYYLLFCSFIAQANVFHTGAHRTVLAQYKKALTPCKHLCALVSSPIYPIDLYFKTGYINPRCCIVTCFLFVVFF